MTSYPIPYLTTSTPSGEKTVDIYSRLLDERIIYLGTPVDDGVSNTVIAQLLHLESDNPDAPVSHCGVPETVIPGGALAPDLLPEHLAPERHGFSSVGEHRAR